MNSIILMKGILVSVNAAVANASSLNDFVCRFLTDLSECVSPSCDHNTQQRCCQHMYKINFVSRITILSTSFYKLLLFHVNFDARHCDIIFSMLIFALKKIIVIPSLKWHDFTLEDLKTDTNLIEIICWYALLLNALAFYAKCNL